MPWGQSEGAAVRQQLKPWDSKREKINQPEHTAGCLQNKGTEQFQRRASQRRPAHPLQRQEAGGRGKGQTWPQRRHPLPNCKEASSF